MILGIDVGLTGAISVFTNDGLFVDVFDLPVMPNGKKGAKVKLQLNAGTLSRYLLSIQSPPTDMMAYMESVSAMPKQGVASMFSLGHSLGTVQAVLASLGIPFMMITPMEWKKHFKLLHADKRASITVVRNLIQTDRVEKMKDHNRADAVLIGLYGATIL